MADFTVTPVAQNIKPIQGMTLGEMMNVARGAQMYQREGIALTLEQQQEAERKRLMEFLSRPENYQTEGRVDINKLNAEVTRIAPLTGADIIQKYTTLGTAQSQALAAAQNLTQTQREMIASRLSIMGRLGVNDKRAYLSELDQLVKENPNNPDLSKLVESYKTTLGVLPDNANFPQLAIAGANSLLNPQTQQQLFAPQAGTIATGAATFPTVTTPSPAGAPPTVAVGQTPLATAQLGPTQREVPTGQYDINNQPIVNVYSPEGRFLGQRVATETPPAAALPGAAMPTPTGAMAPAPGMGMPPAAGTQTFPLAPPPPIQPRDMGAAPGGTTPPARLRPGETPETLREVNQVRTASVAARQEVPLQLFNNNEIIRLADEAITGKGAGALANLTGGYAAYNYFNIGGGNATALNQLGHYMALQTSSLAKSAGLGTDAARGIAAESTGTTNWTPEAIKKTARVNRALSTATDLYSQGIENAFNKSKDPFAVRDFQSKWAQTNDINSITLMDAIRNNDAPGIRDIVTKVGGINSPGYKRLVDNIGKIQSLIKGQ